MILVLIFTAYNPFISLFFLILFARYFLFLCLFQPPSLCLFLSHTLFLSLSSTHTPTHTHSLSLSLCLHLSRSRTQIHQIPNAYGVPLAVANIAYEAASKMDRFPVADAESAPPSDQIGERLGNSDSTYPLCDFSIHLKIPYHSTCIVLDMELVQTILILRIRAFFLSPNYLISIFLNFF